MNRTPLLLLNDTYTYNYSIRIDLFFYLIFVINGKYIGSLCPVYY